MREAATDAAEAKAAFHLHLRARGVRDLQVLRAFERVSRSDFVSPAHHAAAARDLAIPIDCGQTLPPAWVVARMVEALEVRRTHRVLEIGSGSGYTTAILAQLAEEVLGVERMRRLAAAAEERLAALGVTNAALVWGDGLALRSADIGAFDRILVHAVAPATTDSDTTDFAALLRPDGVLVCARPTDRGQAIVRVVERAGSFDEATVCPARLQPLRGGLCGAI